MDKQQQKIIQASLESETKCCPDCKTVLLGGTSLQVPTCLENETGTADWRLGYCPKCQKVKKIFFWFHPKEIKVGE